MIFSFLQNWALTFWSTLNEASPYLVLGLLTAGILHVLVPSKLILWALGKSGFSGAFRGALIGMPLPLCSCSVMPTIMALRKQGASISSSTSFSISTPETSVDALAITMALMPFAFTGIRPIGALLLATLVGVSCEYFSGTRHKKSTISAEKQKDICTICGLAQHQKHRHGGATKLKAILEYALGVFFKDIVSWLLFGLVFAALLQILIPAGGFSHGFLGKSQNLQVLLAILIGIPLYTCATATTPLAAVLMAKGLSPGATLAFILSGPATNVANIFVLRKNFGARVTTVYYASLFIFSLLIGIGLNFLWPVIGDIAPESLKIPAATLKMTALEEHHHHGFIAVSSSIFLLALAVYTYAKDFYLRFFTSQKTDDCCADDHHH